jgi:transposase
MEHFIGIDISKLDFHAALDEEGEVLKFSNDRKGIGQFIRHLKKGGLCTGRSIIGMESTGPYHLLPALMCVKAGYAVNIINPLITKKQNQTSLRRVKNDRKDARLVRYCLTTGAGYPFAADEDALCLKALVRQRNYFADMRIRLKLRQQNMDHKEDCLKRQITSVNQELHDVFTEKIKEIERELSGYSKNLQKLLMTIPGVGPQSAVSFVSEVGDISRFPDAQKLTAFVGLDPRTHESGTSIHGKGYITKRGNKILRNRLFNAASAAVNHPPNIFYDFFNKKRAEGKPYRVALCAAMRKMVHVIHAVWCRGTPYLKEKP